MLSAFFSLKCAALAPFIGARWKHSNTQLKRLFKNNPARKRIEARQGIDHSPLPLDPPKYDAIFQPNFLPNGWCAPAPAELVPTYPFAVGRTKNKPNDAVGFLPVYTKYRKDGTKVITRIKRITGDREAFLAELRSVLNIPVPKNERDDIIRIQAGGTVEVDGNRVRDVTQWLGGLGF